MTPDSDAQLMSWNSEEDALSTVGGVQDIPQALIVGVGGAGNDLLTHLMDASSDAFFCIATDTDRYHLQICRAHAKLLMQDDSSSDAGTFGNIDTGRRAALRNVDKLDKAFDNADLVFVLAGVGGGTGGGAAPVISYRARRKGALVIGLITITPIIGRYGAQLAIESTRRMLNTCDTLVLVDNQGLEPISPILPLGLNLDAPAKMCCSVVESITQAFAKTTSMNGGLRKLRVILKGAGLSRLGIGESYSPFGVEEAVLSALRNSMPLGHLECARGIFLDIIASETIQDWHRESALEAVLQRVNPEADLICEWRTEESRSTSARVSVLATGVPFPFSWGGYRRIPLEIYELEPESGEDEGIGLGLDLEQLESP